MIVRIVTKMRRYSRGGLAFVHDLVMVVAAWGGAYWLRFDLGDIPPVNLARGLLVLPAIVTIQGGVFLYFGLYRGIWRFSSMQDLARIVKGALLGVVLAVVFLSLATRLQAIPRSVFPIYTILLIIMLGGPRFLYRILKENRGWGQNGISVLVVGGGEAGEMLVRDLKRDKNKEYRVVAFVDDNKALRGMEIHGVPVVGGSEDIPRVVERMGVELIMIAVPSATPQQTRRIVSHCEKSGRTFRTLPKVTHLVSGRSLLQELREVKVEDLLGRDQVDLDIPRIQGELTDKVILITGGGGSIGSELCHQVARFNPASLIVIDNSEYNLYRIESELKNASPNLECHFLLADVTDAPALEGVFGRFKPHVIFHAAAYKHVPILEPQVREALRNNVLGTRVAAQAAMRHDVERFILISTDKAVNPSSIMGSSKRIAEIYCQNQPSQNTRFITVRFGNVLDSAGSVVPLFRQQIEAGGPVTVTHPEIERYFMTIPEATQLILQAGVIGKGGEIFVLDMGEPVKIRYLAEQMILLTGKIPGEEIEIVYTGLRPGEKMYEELFHEQEPLAKTSHVKILLANKRILKAVYLEKILDAIQEGVDHNDPAVLMEWIRELVPEYDAHPSRDRNKPIPMTG